MALKAAKRSIIPPFIVMDMMREAAEREAEGGDVIHLEVGQPSTGAPAKVVETAQALLGQDQLGYTVALGLPELRERISQHYATTYGASVPNERIVVTTGSSGGFILAFLSAFEAGDRVALAAPGYPCYRHILAALGVEPVLLEVGPEERFQPTAALLEALDEPVDGLIVASPSNPTGTMLPRVEMEALVQTCKTKGIRLISDEIYHGITYGDPAVTVAGLSEDALAINSFSKYFSMTGWRLGWMVVPEQLLRPIECLAQNLFISPPTLSQKAAVSVFDCIDELEGHVARYAQNRELLLNELPKAGFRDLAPADGAFYIYADIAHMTDDSEVFCRRMLQETGVATTPGVDFDSVRGRHTMRFSFAGSTEDMAEAAKRLMGWVGT